MRSGMLLHFYVLSRFLVLNIELLCQADFPAAVEGHVALISRGTCTFASKVVLAKEAGAGQWNIIALYLADFIPSCRHHLQQC